MLARRTRRFGPPRRTRLTLQAFLTTIGVIAIGFIALVGVVFGYIAYRGHTLDSESRAFVDRVVRDVVAKGDRDELLALFAADRNGSPAQADIVLKAIAQLGPLSDYEGASGRAYMSLINVRSNVTAAYIAKAKFVNGDASFRITLDREQGHWLIRYLHMDVGPGAHLAEN
jgi:hypothetical protein